MLLLLLLPVTVPLAPAGVADSELCQEAALPRPVAWDPPGGTRPQGRVTVPVLGWMCSPWRWRVAAPLAPRGVHGLPLLSDSDLDVRRVGVS